MKHTDKFLLLHDSDSLIPPTNQPMQVWVNVDDIMRVEIRCQRTPKAHVFLRSSLDKPIIVAGDHARTLIASFPNQKGQTK